MRDGRRLATCYHEAGHALARWYFGHFSDRAVVITVADVRAGRWAEGGRRGVAVEAEGFVEGYGIHEVPWDLERIRADTARLRMEEIARDQVLIEAYAGPTAEAVYRKMSAGVCWLLGGGGDSRRIKHILDAWFPDEQERTDTVLTAERRAVALVRSKPGAAAIKAMAEALMARGEIDGDEIAAMCRSAYGGRETGFMEWDAHWPPSLADIRSGVIHEAETRAAA